MRKLFLLFFLLTACAADNPPTIIGTPRFNAGMSEDANEPAEDAPLALPILFRRDASFALYEPGDGAYIGAWLMPEASKRGFEELTGKDHAVFVFEMTLCDDIPVSWILHAIAARATPLIIVHPPENDIPAANLTLYLAERLGSFNLPMFVVFFPGGYHDMTPAEFTAHFRHARHAFTVHAPMAAFVWAAPSHAATPQNPFFPGHIAVDWVALPLLAAWTPEAGYDDILENLAEFYAAFHEHAPIMVLPLAVSNFTRGDYTYRLEEAGEKIAHVYETLRTFPRVGLIVYGDALTLGYANTDDFSISGDNFLAAAYARAIACDYFLPALERETPTSRWQRADLPGFFYQNEIYIPLETLERELNLTAPRQTRVIDELHLAAARRISKKSIHFCENRQVIFVDNFP